MTPCVLLALALALASATEAGPLLGSLEAVGRNRQAGWVLDPAAPAAPVEVELRILDRGRILRSLRPTRNLASPLTAPHRAGFEVRGLGSWLDEAEDVRGATPAPLVIELRGRPLGGAWQTLDLGTFPAAGSRVRDLVVEGLEVQVGFLEDELEVTALVAGARGWVPGLRLELWNEGGAFALDQRPLEDGRVLITARVSLAAHPTLRDLVAETGALLVALRAGESPDGTLLAAAEARLGGEPR